MRAAWAVVLGWAFATAAFAQETADAPEAPDPSALLERIDRALDLSPRQEDRLREVLREARERGLVLRESLRQAYVDLQAARAAGEGTPAVARAAAEVRDARADLVSLRADTMERAQRVLTPAQREQVAAWRAARARR
jgi:Spy/CpxP family protein refolding chaperone